MKPLNDSVDAHLGVHKFILSEQQNSNLAKKPPAPTKNGAPRYSNAVSAPPPAIGGHQQHHPSAVVKSKKGSDKKYDVNNRENINNGNSGTLKGCLGSGSDKKKLVKKGKISIR